MQRYWRREFPAEGMMSAQALKTRILESSQEEASNSSWRRGYLSCHLPPLLKFLKPCALVLFLAVYT